jgi:hypothetical protein
LVELVELGKEVVVSILFYPRICVINEDDLGNAAV